MQVSTQNDHMCIAMAADASYAQHAAIAMISILQHMKHPEQVVFYFLADNVPENILVKVDDSLAQFGAKTYAIPFSEAGKQSLYTSGHISLAAYARLSIAELLPRDVSKVLYVDCDIVAHADIEELWRMDLHGYPVGAVKDFGIMCSHKSWTQKKSLMALDDTMAYFNSGVMLIDLNQWREHHYGKKLLELAQTTQFPHHDQDTLNKMFLNDWCPLPMRWNVIPPVWYLFLKVLCHKARRDEAIEARRHIAILHYAGGYKPWEYRCYPEFNAEYYRALAQSAFRDVPMPQPNLKRKDRSIRRQLRRLKLAEFWQRIFS